MCDHHKRWRQGVPPCEQEYLQSPSHWRATTVSHRELAEYSQHPSSTMGTSIISSIPQLTPANLPLTEATYQDMGKRWGSITAGGKEQCFPRDGPPSPRLPCLAHTSSRQPAAWLCLSFLAKPWVNKLRVIPSAWGYLQRLARLIVTPGSLPVTVSEGRELLSGPCHIKTGSVPSADLHGQFQEIFKEHPSQ